MKKETGKVIKALREHFNYKQEYVAKKLNVTVATVANIENGRVLIDLEKLYQLSKLYSISTSSIVELITNRLESATDEELNVTLKKIFTVQSPSNV